MPTAADPLASHWGQSSLADLLLRLRQAGFPIGTTETLDAFRLLAALAHQRPDIDTAALRVPLRAAVCKSAAQQRRFDVTFEQWRQTLVLRWKAAGVVVPDAGSDEMVDLRPNRRWVWAVALATVGVLVLVVLLILSRLQPAPVPVAPVVAAASAPASAPATVAARAPQPAQILAYAPIVVYRSEVRPKLVWLALLPPFVLLLSVGLDIGSRQLGGMRSRDAGERTALAGWSREQVAKRVLPNLPDDTIERLQRHVHGPPTEMKRLERRPQIHLRRTVEATFRNLGLPTLHFRDARLVPSYLILVEAEHGDDYAVLWAERLARQRLQVDLRRIVWQNGEPCAVRQDAGPQDRGVPLAALSQPPWGQRLVIVSSGHWAADAQGSVTRAFRDARFGRWPQRVFFTPLEPRRWGAVEDAIERPGEGGDAGFLLLPIDESALDAWTRLIATGHLPEIELENPQHFPRLLHDVAETRWLEDQPPGDIALLVAQLKRYLGPNGYFWLACCAVPPLVHPQLTLLLGDTLLRIGGAGEDALPQMLARNYRLLLRLPWLRLNQMPEWLRVVLLASLPAAVQHEVRTAVHDLLARQLPEAAGNLLLAFEPPPKAGDRAATRPAGSGDMLYVGFMSGLQPDELALRVPGEWQRWIDALHRRSRDDWRLRWADRLAAAWDRLRYQRGLSVLGARRWPLWMLLAWLAVVGGLAVVLDAPAPAHAPGAERRAALRERPDRVEMRHGGSVHSAAFSPDGTRVVTASFDGNARMWEAGSGRPIGKPIKHGSWVNSAAFSSDGMRVVTASGDGNARVWDAGSGQPIGEPMKHGGTVNRAAFSPDGTRVVTASEDGSARVWDAASGRPIGEPMEHGGTVNRAAFSPEGTRVVTASEDGSARVWDAASGRPISEPMKHGGPVNSAAFSPDGTLVVTASKDGSARVWDAGSGRPIGEPIKHSDIVWSAAFSPDGTRVVTASGDGSARVWDAGSGQPIGKPMKHGSWVNSAAFSPDGMRVVTAGGDGNARVWDAGSGRPIGEPMKHGNQVNSAAFNPDGTRVVTASEDGSARVWDAGSSQPIGEPMEHGGTVNRAAFSPDGTRVVTASVDGSARVWDAASGRPIGEPMKHGSWVWSAAFSPDGTRVVTASRDGSARVWDAASGRPIGEPMKHGNQVNSAAFSPDGTRVVTASDDDGSARVWDATSGRPISEPMRHEGTVYSAAFSPDGTRVVTASGDYSARVWDAGSGRPIGEPMRHRGLGTVWSAAFSPDGMRVVTASEDGSARVWDAANGGLMGVAAQADGLITDAQFSSDGYRIAVATRGVQWVRQTVRGGLPGNAAYVVPAILTAAQLDRPTVAASVVNFLRPLGAGAAAEAWVVAAGSALLAIALAAWRQRRTGASFRESET